MSQKSTRRAKKLLEQASENGDRKASNPVEWEKKTEKVEKAAAIEEKDAKKGSIETEAADSIAINEVQESPPKTPSRSNTPQNRNDAQVQVQINVSNSTVTEAATEKGEKIDEETLPEIELQEENDDIILELQFDDSEIEVESEGSPNRCRTRRSYSRNLSTPNTPKIDVVPEAATATAKVDDEDQVSIQANPPTPYQNGDSPSASLNSHPELPELECEPSSPKENGSSSNHFDSIDLNESESLSSASTDNISTKATIGDSTRNVDFSYADSSLLEENSFLSAAKDRSIGETLRGLSSRRTIRPMSGNDFRKQTLIKSLDKRVDFHSSFAYHSTVETFGVKRKHRSTTPESGKRLKTEHMGLFAYITEPLQSIRNRLRGENRTTSTASSTSSSTPKLTSYSEKAEFFNEDVSKIGLEIDTPIDEANKWCSIV